MLKEVLCVFFLIVVCNAAQPTFKIVNGSGPRSRLLPSSGRVRHHYNHADEFDDDSDNDDDDDDDVRNFNGADPTGPGPLRDLNIGTGGGGRGATDPLAIRTARLHAYRAALLRSIRAEEEFDNHRANTRYPAGGSGGGGNNSFKRRPLPLRDAYDGGNAANRQHHQHLDGSGQRNARRPPNTRSRTTTRGQRIASAIAASRDLDDDDGYY